MCKFVESIAQRQSVEHTCMELRRKLGPVGIRLSRSRDVNESDTVRSVSYDFLLVIYSRYVVTISLTCTVSEI